MCSLNRAEYAADVLLKRKKNCIPHAGHIFESKHRYSLFKPIKHSVNLRLSKREMDRCSIITIEFLK